ncbi:hypothetical protein LINPERHAP1_LOCUS31121, partial [Linum perenne]
RFKPPWFDPDIKEVCETEILGSGVGYVRGRVNTPVPPDSKSVLLNYDKFSFICGAC